MTWSFDIFKKNKILKRTNFNSKLTFIYNYNYISGVSYINYYLKNFFK